MRCLPRKETNGDGGREEVFESNKCSKADHQIFIDFHFLFYNSVPFVPINLTQRDEWVKIMYRRNEAVQTPIGGVSTTLGSNAPTTVSEKGATCDSMCKTTRGAGQHSQMHIYAL